MKEVDPKQVPDVTGGLAPRQFEEQAWAETVPARDTVDYNPPPLAQ